MSCAMLDETDSLFGEGGDAQSISPRQKRRPTKETSGKNILSIQSASFATKHFVDEFEISNERLKRKQKSTERKSTEVSDSSQSYCNQDFDAKENGKLRKQKSGKKKRDESTITRKKCEKVKRMDKCDDENLCVHHEDISTADTRNHTTDFLEENERAKPRQVKKETKRHENILVKRSESDSLKLKHGDEVEFEKIRTQEKSKFLQQKKHKGEGIIEDDLSDQTKKKKPTSKLEKIYNKLEESKLTTDLSFIDRKAPFGEVNTGSTKYKGNEDYKKEILRLQQKMAKLQNKIAHMQKHVLVLQGEK